MSYQGIIFDLDGVICHTDLYHYQAWKHIADELGIPFDEQINHRLRGVSRMESLEIILEGYAGHLDEMDKARYAEEKNNIYRQLLCKMSPADLDVEVQCTLDLLRGKGLRLAIGSSSKNARFILEQIGLGNYFDAIADGTDITRSKPDPQVFLLAAKALGLPPSTCLVVEDAQAGVEAAHAGGMDCAAMGEAVHCGIAKYQLTAFRDLLLIAKD